MYLNENDVRAQMVGWGLVLDQGPLVVNKITRTRVAGRKGKKGWYHLYDTSFTNEADGRTTHLLTGAFGHFEGAEHYYAKVSLNKDDLPKISPEQLAENRKRQAEAEKRAKAELVKRQQTAAITAQRVWRRCNRLGHADYLDKKLIHGHDVRFTDKNAIVIPLTDTSGYIWGLQFILDKTQHKDKIAKREGNNKEFWPPGLAKKGNFFQIGPMITSLCLISEGYATGASLHEATGLPVVIAFDATNLHPVIQILTDYYTSANFLICADDDDLYGCLNCHAKIQLSQIDDFCPHCGQPHKRKNAGVDAAMRACANERVRWIRPKFDNNAERWGSYEKNQGKWTDFNDLHAVSSLATVRRQVEQTISGLGWALDGAARATQNGGAGDDEDLNITTLPEAIGRIWTIYGTSLVFDEKYKMIYTLRAFYDGCAVKNISTQWKESKHRKRVLLENIGFDPAGVDPKVICNLWDKWPIAPKEGDCDLILDLLLYLCSGEKNSVELAAWLLKWIAYPLQHPGAKMQTAVIIYGPQGTGKNILGDAIKGIYGKYGATISQRALETQFNEFLSKKLFIVANEVASSSEKYEMKNALKTFITDEEIWINPKGVAAYFEQNHCNILFFSNERMPLVLEHDDRRHCVMWTPPPKPDDYYIAVANQIHNGGIEAFYYYLLNLPLGDFNEHTKPPMTNAKKELIDLSKPPILRFYDDWSEHEIEGVPFVPATKDDIYAVFKVYCIKNGCRASTSTSAIDRLSKLPGASKEIKWLMVERDGQWVQRQKTFYFFKGVMEKPPGQGEIAFMTDCVERLRAGINHYKGGAYE